MNRSCKQTSMSLAEIAEEEGISIGAVNMILSRALRKLRRDGLLLTALELSIEFDRHRAGEHIVRTAGRR